MTVADPYKALGLGHDASQDDVKKSYRKLAMQLHPDRLSRNNATEEEKQNATSKFAEITSAYGLLSDEARKRQYDHIFRFGGYDVEPRLSEKPFTPSSNGPASPRGSPEAPLRKKSSSKGIGYTVCDPVSFILSQGKVRNTTVAGVQIPSRFNMAQSPDGGFRVSFSHGMLQESPSGTLKHVAKTTQFVRGKKFSRVETTTVHKDGRKEVLIEGEDYVERRYSTAPKRKRQNSHDGDGLTHQGDELPWYMSAWNGLRDNLQMCYNPCGAISVR
jgi:curved DNA-binding protein CbpA